MKNIPSFENGPYYFIKNYPDSIKTNSIKHIEKDDKAFFIINEEKIHLQNTEYEGHTSIYKTSNDEDIVVSTYHYTLQSEDGSIHVYFDKHGNYLKTLSKNLPKELSHLATTFAKNNALPLIFQIIKAIKDKPEELEKIFLDHSKNLDAEFKNQDSANKAIKIYKDSLKEYIDFHKLNLTNNTKEEMILLEKIYENEITVKIKSKEEKTKKKNTEIKKESPKKEKENSPLLNNSIFKKKKEDFNQVLKEFGKNNNEKKLTLIEKLERGGTIESEIKLYKKLMTSLSSKENIENYRTIFSEYSQKLKECIFRLRKHLKNIIEVYEKSKDKEKKFNQLKNIVEEVKDLEIPLHFFLDIITELSETQILEYLISKNKIANINQFSGKSNEYNTLLLQAIINKKDPYIEGLLKNGADTNLYSPLDGKSTFGILLSYYKNTKDRKKWVSLLLEYNLNINLNTFNTKIIQDDDYRNKKYIPISIIEDLISQKEWELVALCIEKSKFKIENAKLLEKFLNGVTSEENQPLSSSAKIEMLTIALNYCKKNGEELYDAQKEIEKSIESLQKNKINLKF